MTCARMRGIFSALGPTIEENRQHARARHCTAIRRYPTPPPPRRPARGTDRGGFARGLRSRWGAVLGDILPRQSLIQCVIEEAGIYRERLYGPLATLSLFIEQVLGADHSCQDAVARGLSARVALGPS